MHFTTQLPNPINILPVLVDEQTYQMSQETLHTFKNSWHQEHNTDLNDSNYSLKPKCRNIFVIFIAFLLVLEIKVNSILQKFHGCRMTEQEPKRLFMS